MIYDAKDCAHLRNGVLLVSLTAWVYLAAGPQQSCHDPALAFGSSVRASLDALADVTLGWLIMLVAMMAPMTLGGLYHVRVSSFVARRWRSSTLFLTGYGTTWMVAGCILVAAELTAKRLAPQSIAPAVAAGVVALIWQTSPFKQRCLNRCHDHRALAAFGRAADRDAWYMGLEHGVWCVGSCWATMLVPLLLPQGHFAAMMAVTVLMFCERLDPPRGRAWRLRGFQSALRVLQLRLLGPRTSPPPSTIAAST
jgi:predicted metal-binding membrane protein